MRKTLTTLSALLLSSVAATAQVTIDIDAAQRGAQVSPMLYGIFFEDINHAADGGLYAELIQNRSFEDSKTDIAAWFTAANGASTIKSQLTDKKLLNNKQGQALQLNIAATADAPVALGNYGFWGIHAVPGRTYKLSLWIKGNYKGTIKAQLSDKSGQQVYAETTLQGGVSKKWNKLTAQMTSQANDPQACFRLLFDGKGEVTLDVISLFPPTFKNRENGCRPELAQLLQNLQPKFMRFPGGCFVEGQKSPDNAFHWERTVGSIEERPGHRNENWGYRTSDGLGFHEFLQLSEDLGAKPLYVVNVGLWHGGLTPVDSLEPWIQECLDALEYANGDVTTKYGAVRAKNGHPAPFNIEYLEIGNENNQHDPAQQSDRYYDRYKKFKDAVLTKYPKMHLIGNVVAWGDDDPKWNSTEEVELLDEHYYRNPAWFADNFRKYDSYDRKGPKIYCGEYAVTQGFGKFGHIGAALGEAVFMMGMENNSDHVTMASYAPIFVNENNIAWQPDMIRYNASQVMCTPSYYVQKLMAENVGTRILSVTQNDPYTDRLLKKSAQPAESRYGFGTWGTKASFQYRGETSVVDGEWKNDGNVVSQVGYGEGLIALTSEKLKSPNYTIKTRCRKDAGGEGFLVIFNYVDPDNYCWINIGGWGNTQHALEQVVNGSKIQTAMKPGHVEEGRWYDVKIEEEGDHVKCWLDNELIIDTQLRQNESMGVFSSATLDENTGEVIVKVVNPTPEPTTAALRLKNFAPSKARVIRLAATKGTAENTMDSPTNVYPIEETVALTPDNVSIDVPANSLNIIRLKK